MTATIKRHAPIIIAALALAPVVVLAATAPAHAGVPDPGADRKETIAELKALNEKLGGMLKLMESGKLQVEVVAADNKK